VAADIFVVVVASNLSRVPLVDHVSFQPITCPGMHVSSFYKHLVASIAEKDAVAPSGPERRNRAPEAGPEGAEMEMVGA